MSDTPAVECRVRAIVADRVLTKHWDGLDGAPIRIAVGGAPPGWSDYDHSHAADTVFRAAAPTPADALMLLYFTSGTTAKPKLVAHSQTSYAVGHLSTAYWIGLRRGDVHLNLSSPGWAKHAWSCFFAPWNAEAFASSVESQDEDGAAALLNGALAQGLHFADLEPALAAAAYVAALLNEPSDQVADLVLRAIAAGNAARLFDHPLPDADDWRRLVSLAQTRGLKFFVEPFHRFAPSMIGAM